MYELLVFVHVLGAVIWLGAGITVHLMGRRALVPGDDKRAGDYVDLAGAVGKFVFGVAPPVTILAGIGLVFWQESWAWSQFWVYTALILVVVAAFMGAVVDERAGAVVKASIAEDGTSSPQFASSVSRFHRIGEIELALILIILALMVFKPGA